MQLQIQYLSVREETPAKKTKIYELDKNELKIKSTDYKITNKLNQTVYFNDSIIIEPNETIKVIQLTDLAYNEHNRFELYPDTFKS